MSDERTIIDEFEDVLGVPFDPAWTKAISIDAPTGRRLEQAVTKFYKNFRLPDKDRGEMRPYLFPYYTTANKPWMNFVAYQGTRYTFTPSRDTDLLEFLKPFLLYCHGICFLDPLPGLLVYFRLVPGSDVEKARVPAVAHLLLEYVKIAPLIRRQAVVPVSNEVFGYKAFNLYPLSDSEDREITDVLAGNSRYAKQLAEPYSTRYAGEIIKQQLWLNQYTENRIDLYFPEASCLPILQGLWQAASHHYSSKEIYEPFAVGVLANLASLDTSKISMMDILTIRSESAFDDYRRVLQRILQRLQDREGKFSDLESEFALAAREEMAECDDKIKQLTKKSNVLRDTLKNLDRILIGGATGALGGLLAGSSEAAVLAAAAGVAVRPIYDVIRGAWTASPSSVARTSLRHHFLVLDPERSSK